MKLLIHYVFQDYFCNSVSMNRKKISSAQRSYWEQAWFKMQYHVSSYHVFFNVILASVQDDEQQPICRKIIVQLKKNNFE